MWNEEGANRYEHWYETATGGFAFQQERRLLEHLISGWPRRGRTMLEVGCGTGLFLKSFWEAGFEVSGLDASPDMLGLARKRLGPKAAYHVGKAEHLPFEDNEFDYCALLTVLEFCDEPARVLLEASRVASKGVLLAFLNRYSMYYLERGRKPSPDSQGDDKGSLRRARWFTCLEMRRLVASCLGPRPVRGGSVLPGPMWSWSAGAPWRWINGLRLPMGLGAYCALRVDLVGDKVQTPLYAFKTEPTPGR